MNIKDKLESLQYLNNFDKIIQKEKTIFTIYSLYCLYLLLKIITLILTVIYYIHPH